MANEKQRPERRLQMHCGWRSDLNACLRPERAQKSEIGGSVRVRDTAFGGETYECGLGF
jgi:hypothetical protein